MAAQEYFSSFQQSQARPPYATSPYGQSPQPNYQPSPYLQPPGQTYTPQGQPPPRPQQQQGYPFPQPSPQYAPQTASNLTLPPLQPSRTKSQPPENRMRLYEEDRGHKHHHHHSNHHSRSRSRSRSRHSHSRRSSSRSGSRRQSHEISRDNRDTFLGAGGGAIIGDSLFPGLGTLGGALFGGLGGHRYAKSRSKSDSGYRDGITVKSGFIRR